MRQQHKPKEGSAPQLHYPLVHPPATFMWTMALPSCASVVPLRLFRKQPKVEMLWLINDEHRIQNGVNEGTAARGSRPVLRSAIWSRATATGSE